MKKLTAVAGAGICAALLFSGCSNIKELNKALGDASAVDEVSTLGLCIEQDKTTQAEVLNSIGAPSMTFAEADGGSTWVYTRVAVRNHQAAGRLSANFAAVFPYKPSTWSRGGGLAGAGANASLASQSSSYKTAALMIHFNGEGRVSNYEFTATSF